MVRYSRGPVEFAGRITPQSIDANQRVNLRLGDTLMGEFYFTPPSACLPVQQIASAWASAGYLWLHAALPPRAVAYWWSYGR